MLRGCLKQKPSDNTKPLIQDPEYGHLLRSFSTPSLKRCWSCQNCHLLNNSVTWHCLNCEWVCMFAPIYKDTLQKATTKAIDANECLASGSTDIAQLKAKKIAGACAGGSISGYSGNNAGNVSNASGVSGKLQRFSMDSASDNVKKCQLCVFNVQLGGSELKSGCQHRGKYIHFPWIAGDNGSDGYSHQKTYNVYTRYQGNVGLLSANRRANKSLSCIDDAFGVLNNVSDGVFGEQILTSANRPNTLGVSVQENELQDGVDSVTAGYSRQLSVPNTESEIHQFTNFAAISASENAQRKIPCPNCGVTNHNNCTGINRTSTGMINSSNFQLTTMPRNGTNSRNTKPPTLSRNCGVFVAIRDWSQNANTAEIQPLQSNSTTLQGNYYELLKNSNNNGPAYENTAVINQIRRDAETNASPVYAVVSKANKIKNKQPYTALIEPTKYTYIGMAPSEKSSKDTVDSPIYASARKPASANVSSGTNVPSNNSNNDNNNIAVLTNSESVNSNENDVNDTNATTAENDYNSSHITITSSANTSGAETSNIYAKVWKGPRKSLDSQKMYVFVLIANLFRFSYFIKLLFQSDLELYYSE